jgi:hypothetical protein
MSIQPDNALIPALPLEPVEPAEPEEKILGTSEGEIGLDDESSLVIDDLVEIDPKTGQVIPNSKRRKAANMHHESEHRIHHKATHNPSSGGGDVGLLNHEKNTQKTTLHYFTSGPIDPLQRAGQIGLSGVSNLQVSEMIHENHIIKMIGAVFKQENQADAHLTSQQDKAIAAQMTDDQVSERTL